MTGLKLERRLSFDPMRNKILRVLDRLLPSPLLRAVFVLAVAFGLMHAVAAAPRGASIMLMALMAGSVAMELKRVWRQSARGWARRMVRLIKTCRSTLKSSPAVRAIHLVSILLCLLLLLFFAIRKDVGEVHEAFVGIGVVMIMAGLLDFTHVVAALTRFAWARVVGKAVLAALSVASAWAAGVVASHMIAGVTGLDPKPLEASSMMLRAVYTPVIYVGICALVVLLVASFFFVVINMAAITFQNIRTLSAMVPRFSAPTHKASVAYRLVHGKNRPWGTRRPWFEWDSPVILLRPLATALASAGVLWATSAMMETDESHSVKLLNWLVASVDFNADHRCANLGRLDRVHYVEDDKVLIASPAAGAWFFRVGRCESR